MLFWEAAVLLIVAGVLEYWGRLLYECLSGLRVLSLSSDTLSKYYCYWLLYIYSNALMD